MIWFLYLIQLSSAANPNPTWAELSHPDNWNYSHSTETQSGTVKVYTKMVDNFPCFQGLSQAPLDPHLLQEIAADAKSAMEWSSADITEAIELQRTKTYVDYYQYLDVPMFSDRYWFLRGYFEEDETTVRFRWERLEKGGAHSQKYQQVQKDFPNAEETPINIGSWIFTPKDDITIIQYYICTHPGGNVPTMLQSIATENTLPNNLNDLILEGYKRSSTKP